MRRRRPVSAKKILSATPAIDLAFQNGSVCPKSLQIIYDPLCPLHQTPAFAVTSSPEGFVDLLVEDVHLVLFGLDPAGKFSDRDLRLAQFALGIVREAALRPGFGSVGRDP